MTSLDGEDSRAGYIVQRLPLEHQFRDGCSLRPIAQSMQTNLELLGLEMREWTRVDRTIATIARLDDDIVKRYTLPI